MRYKYYFSSFVTVTVTAGAVAVATPFTGVLRIAVLRSSVQPILSYDAATAASVEQLYDTYAGAARGMLLWHVLCVLCCLPVPCCLLGRRHMPW